MTVIVSKQPMHQSLIQPPKNRECWSLAVCGILLWCAISQPLMAAPPTAAELTPRDLRPEQPQTPPVIDRDMLSKHPRLSDEVTRLQVVVGEIMVEDGLPDMAEATAALIAPFEDKRVTVGELQALASSLESLYLKAGYILVRVTIPPQDLRDNGVFRLRVIDGHVESLYLDGVSDKLQPVVMRHLKSLVGKTGLKANELERALLLASRLPGLSLRSALMPGEQVGGTVLAIQGDYQRISGSLRGDNYLPDDLGPWAITFQFQANQPTSNAEQFYLYFSGHLEPLIYDRNRRRVAGAGVRWLLGNHGTMLNVEATTSKTDMPGQGLTVPAIESHFKRQSLRLSHPVWLTRQSELNVTGVFERSTQYQNVPLFDLKFSRDNLHVLRFNTDGLYRFSSGTLSGNVQYSQGIRGSSYANSRPGADPDFAKIETQLRWSMSLPWGMHSVSVLRGQHAFGGSLPSAETFSMDGDSALASLESGVLNSDGGWTLREEISKWIPIYESLSMAPYVFIAGGYPYDAASRPVKQALAAGGGLRGVVGSVNFTVQYGISRMSPGQLKNETLFASIEVAY